MSTPLLQSRTWLLWLLLAFAVLLSTRNPVYLLLMLLAVQLVGHVCGQAGVGWQLRWWPLVPIVLLLPSFFHMASVHSGDTVLWTLPASLPWLGGPWTLEAWLFGLSSGLVLLGLLLLFSTFNRVVAVQDLVRLSPRLRK